MGPGSSTCPAIRARPTATRPGRPMGTGSPMPRTAPATTTCIACASTARRRGTSPIIPGLSMGSPPGRPMEGRWPSPPTATAQLNLTNTPGASDFQPAWSPDGATIAFTSDRDGDQEIYLMSADGSGQLDLTNTPDASDFDPVFSPDGGTRIVF